MATIQLQKHECKDGWLPPICMVCGEPANEDEPIPHKFSWTPSWVWILILAGLIWPFVVGAILRKRRTVFTPMCEEHRGYWANRWWMGFGILAGLFGMIGAMIALAQFNAPPWTYVAAVVAFLVSLIGSSIVSNNSIRPTYIDDYVCHLTNVNGEFRERVREQQEQDDEEIRERKRQRRERRERGEEDDNPWK